MDFCKQVTGPFVPSFAIRMYVAFTDTLRSQTQTCKLLNFMHTIPTKVDPDKLKGCQICNDHSKLQSPQYQGLPTVTKGYY